MTIATTSVTTATIDTGNSVATASQSPAANELWGVDVYMRTTNITPSVSGTGLTWASVDSIVNAQTQFKIFRFRGLSTGSPSSGAITVTVTGNLKPVNVHVWKATGIDTSGTNGSGAFQQTVTDGGPAVTDDTNMKKAITTVNANAVVVAFGGYRQRTFTLPGGTGETAIGSLNLTSGTGGDVSTSSVWYKAVAVAGSTTMGADGDLNNVADWAMIVSELKPAAISFSDSVTITRVMSLPVSASKTVAVAATLAIFKAISESGQANTQGILTVAAFKAIVESASNTASSIVALAILNAISAQGGKIVGGAVVMEILHAISESGQANAFGSHALSQIKGISESGQANAQGILIAAIFKALTEAGQASAWGSALLSQIRSLTGFGQADTGASLTLGLMRAISPQGGIGLYDTVSLSKFLAVTTDGQRNALVDVTLSQILTLSASAQAQTQGSASVGRGSALSVSGQADRQGDLTISLIRQMQALGSTIFTGGLSLDHNLGLSITEHRSLLADLELILDFALGFDGQRAYDVQVSLSHITALTTSSFTSAHSTVGLGKILHLVILDEFLQFILTVPLKRKAIVAPEIRLFDTESRPCAITVGQEDRIYIVI